MAAVSFRPSRPETGLHKILLNIANAWIVGFWCPRY
jgi:hypothetical protein